MTKTIGATRNNASEMSAGDSNAYALAFCWSNGPALPAALLTPLRS
jgi:hypothetical protein